MDLPTKISQLQDSLFKNEYTCVDLVDEYLGRINTFDKDLNSFLTITDDQAYKSAKEIDSIIKNEGKSALTQKPLLGVVISVKDLFLTKGIRTTAGSKVLENYIPAYSSTVYKRLIDAGCVLIGKTNCDAWAHGASGENSDFGPTKNPWNKNHVPGGSSSGSAVSVSGRFCLASTGTDTGGSIRQPANFCGVVGFKPTYGAVSRYGVVAMASSLDSMGHFTNSVEDSEKIYNVTKGLDGKDGTLKEPEKCDVPKEVRIGIPKEYFVKGIDPQVEAEVKRVIELFEEMGYKTQEISLPHTKYAISVYYIVQPAEVSSNLGRYDGVRYGNSRDSFGAEAKRRIMLGSYVLSSGYWDAYYLKAMKVRSLIIDDFDKAFENVDAIIAPVSPTPAFKLGEKSDNPLQMYLADIYTVAANLAGIPGISIPSGVTKENLPLGFQLMGKRFSETVLFELGKKFQERFIRKTKFPTL